jgi:hypothetical protein
VKQEFDTCGFRNLFNGLLYPELTFNSDKAWFTLSRYVNSQNNRYWYTEVHHAIQEVPVHDVKVKCGAQLVLGK